MAALGWMCEPSLTHWYPDNVWADLGRGAGCLRHLRAIAVDHLNVAAGHGKPDATAVGNGRSLDADRDAYYAWRRERMAADIDVDRETARAGAPARLIHPFNARPCRDHRIRHDRRRLCGTSQGLQRGQQQLRRASPSGAPPPVSEFPILMYGTTSGEFNVSAIRVGTYSGSSASYPSNGTITWRLRRASGSTCSAGVPGGTGTAYPVGQSTTAAVSTWYYSTSTNATGTFSTMAPAAVGADDPLHGRRELG